MKNVLVILMGLMMASVSMAAANTKNCKDEANYPLIDKASLQAHVQKKDAFIVDVNSDKSYQEAHIGNAIHFADHKNDFAKTLPADKNALIVAYCGNEMCTAWKNAAEKACGMGYTNVMHFKPGIQGWMKK